MSVEREDINFFVNLFESESQYVIDKHAPTNSKCQRRFKISKIRKTLEDFPSFRQTLKHVQLLENFEDPTETEVKRLISELNTKSCELYLSPTHILKSHLDELLPTITKLINLLLFNGVFPTHWKQAIVRPLLKKSGLE